MAGDLRSTRKHLAKSVNVRDQFDTSVSEESKSPLCGVLVEVALSCDSVER